MNPAGRVRVISVSFTASGVAAGRTVEAGDGTIVAVETDSRVLVEAAVGVGSGASVGGGAVVEPRAAVETASVVAVEDDVEGDSGVGFGRETLVGSWVGADVGEDSVVALGTRLAAGSGEPQAVRIRAAETPNNIATLFRNFIRL